MKYQHVNNRKKKITSYKMKKSSLAIRKKKIFPKSSRV